MAKQIGQALTLLVLIGGLSVSTWANPISRAGSATKHGLASVASGTKQVGVAVGRGAVRVAAVPVHGVEDLVHRL